VLARRGAIDKKLVYYLQEYWLTRYYLVARPYIEESRKLDPDTWMGVERLAESFLKKSPGDVSPESLQEFLREEARYDPKDYAEKG
jgi:hypothetical protein